MDKLPPCPFCKATLNARGGYYACPNKACSFPMGVAPTAPEGKAETAQPCYCLAFDGPPVDPATGHRPPCRTQQAETAQAPDLEAIETALRWADTHAVFTPASPVLEAAWEALRRLRSQGEAHNAARELAAMAPARDGNPVPFADFIEMTGIREIQLDYNRKMNAETEKLMGSGSAQGEAPQAPDALREAPKYIEINLNNAQIRVIGGPELRFAVAKVLRDAADTVEREEAAGRWPI